MIERKIADWYDMNADDVNDIIDNVLWKIKDRTSYPRSVNWDYSLNEECFRDDMIEFLYSKCVRTHTINTVK